MSGPQFWVFAPGGAGPAGAPAESTITAAFVQPAIGATVQATIADTRWMVAGADTVVAGGGYYLIVSVDDGTHATIRNYGYAANVVPGTNVAAPAVIAPTGTRGASGTGRIVPALDPNSYLAWDFQTLNGGAQNALGAAQPAVPYLKNLGAGPACDLSVGFANAGGGGAGVLSPLGHGLGFYALGGASGGIASAASPPAPPAQHDFCVEAFFFTKDTTTTAEGVIFSKAFDAVSWTAPFNSIEMNYATGNGGILEFGMTDLSTPGAEIGGTVGGRFKMNVGFHHAALVATGHVLSAYCDGVLAGSVAYGLGVLYGTGPWMFGGNKVNTSDASNIVMCYAQVSDIARSPAYIAASAAGWGAGQ